MKSCSCGDWQVKVTVARPLKELSPRLCDCGYCQKNCSPVVSDTTMEIELLGGKLNIDKNGDRLAEFYHCRSCGDFLAVSCLINGVLRGAVNTQFLDNMDQLGDSISVQPRLLNASEKLDRWSKLWGILSVI